MSNSLVREKNGASGYTYAVFSPVLNNLFPYHHHPTIISSIVDVILLTIICNYDGKTS